MYKLQHMNPFEMAQRQFDEAAEILGLDEASRDLLRTPQRELQVTFPVRMDNGDHRVFRGYRVLYNSSRGPGKGGLRWHPEETIDTVRALAAWMTWKTSLVNLPLGGAKGGVTCNPKELSDGEKERLARGYIRAIGHSLGDRNDIPAPDVYTTPQIMAWMRDEFEAIRGKSVPGMITGKPIEFGGSPGRADATARGGIFVTREACHVLGVDVNNGTCAINGFGNAGQNAALLAEQVLGLKVIAVSDSKGGLYNEKGLSPTSLIRYKKDNKYLTDYPEAEVMSNKELLELPVTVLFPSALENVINEENASKIKAKVICELANGPTTPEADHILRDQGTFVIPDFLANAGGVTVSYFEQVQAASNYYWPVEEVHQKLDKIMTSSFSQLYDVHKTKNVHPRLAGYLVAVKRVAEACRLRGWI